jgi:hypothetical protein
MRRREENEAKFSAVELTSHPQVIPDSESEASKKTSLYYLRKSNSKKKKQIASEQKPKEGEAVHV